MKAGAVDFIEKPFLLAALEDGFQRLENAGKQDLRAELARWPSPPARAT